MHWTTRTGLRECFTGIWCILLGKGNYEHGLFFLLREPSGHCWVIAGLSCAKGAVSLSLLGTCVSQWIHTWCHLNPWSEPAKTELKKCLASGRGKLWLCARGGDASGALSPALGLSGRSISVPAELFSSALARRKADSCLHLAQGLATYLHCDLPTQERLTEGAFCNSCAWPAACWVSWHGQLRRCLFWWSILHKAVLEANIFCNFHLWREFKRCCSALPVGAKNCSALFEQKLQRAAAADGSVSAARLSSTGGLCHWVCLEHSVLCCTAQNL